MLLLGLALALAASPARANDGSREEIDSLYLRRDQGRNLDASISELDALIGKSGPPQSDIYWRRCRSLIRRGEKREKKSDKLADYDAARKDCEKSVALYSRDADAHFWHGVAMGRWGEAKGILKAMFLVKPIRREMEATLKLDPGHGGAHRVLGEMLWQIPGIAGGDKKKALEEFEAAVRLSPNQSSNYQPLAEAYLYFDRKGDAVRALNEVVAIKNPAEPAEYPDDLADARKLLSVLGPR